MKKKVWGRLWTTLEKFWEVFFTGGKTSFFRAKNVNVSTKTIWSVLCWLLLCFELSLKFLSLLSCGPNIQYKKLAKSQTAVFSKSSSLHESERNYCSPTLLITSKKPCWTLILLIVKKMERNWEDLLRFSHLYYFQKGKKLVLTNIIFIFFWWVLLSTM